jgi:HPt (histidine-containing phosphotransfer) domain-containing protein
MTSMSHIPNDCNNHASALTPAVSSATVEPLQSGTHANETGEIAAATDPAILATLEKSLGSTAFGEILNTYIASTDELCEGLEAAGVTANWSEVVRLAQSIAGNARGLGFVAVARAAHAFADALHQDASRHILRNKVQMIVLEHERVKYALENLYPGLTA